MKVLIGLALLFSIPFICLAEEETKILDNHYQIQYRIKDGKVYDNDYMIKYRFKDGNIYDSHYGKVGSYKGPNSIPSAKGEGNRVFRVDSIGKSKNLEGE